MYMRLMKLRLLPGALPEMFRLYRERIIPGLQTVDGCLFAVLTENAKRSHECVSLTLWDSRENMIQYERDGRFAELLKEAAPYLAESGEWRVQLSDELTLTYGPAKEPPSVGSYRLDVVMPGGSFERLENLAEYLRVLRLPIAPSRFAETKKYYEEEAVPALRKVPGCLYAGLLTNLATDGQIVSMTIWSKKSAAEAFEKSELYRKLMRDARELVGARSWDLMLENEQPGSGLTERAVKAQEYGVVAGKDLRQR